MDLMTLPENYKLRPASPDDIRKISFLVLKSRLDPTQLNWQQFKIIECEKSIVACGQLRYFPDAQELGSLFVLPAWRGRGFGTYLAQSLIQEATKPLYLECLGKRRARFYNRLGFVPISWQNLPQSLQAKFGIYQLGKSLLEILFNFMKYQI